MTSGQRGVFVSKDFNPAYPLAATWTRDVAYPGGRAEDNCVLATDPTEPEHYVAATPAGGAFDRTLKFTAKAA